MKALIMKKNITAVSICNILLISSQAYATLTPTLERGVKNVYHNSPYNNQEVCVIPLKYPSITYKQKDLEKETKLCNLSFYETTSEEKAAGKETAALCAKINSSNPGVSIFRIKPPETKDSVESANCENASKIGKYKNSTSCSYTPSILSYYHVSRILGNIGNVPVAVLRTMDLTTHKAMAQQGLRNTKSGDLINETWKGLNSILNAGASSTRKDLIFTDDFKQTYGAFVVNPKDEEFYKAFFNGGTDRAATFRDTNQYFKLVKDTRPLNQLISAQWSKDGLQKLVAMKDITEFILLDHILDQQDRFGNIAKETKFMYMAKKDAAATTYKLTSGDADDLKKATDANLVDKTRPAVQLDFMVLKDNDCGVNKENRIKKAGLLMQVKHMEPKTYTKLLQFQKSLNDPANVEMNKKFFLRNLMFSTTDYSEFIANVNDAVKILQTNCRSKALKLDLDIDGYMENTSIAGSCELP
jgi:hypothetical protein